MLTIDWCRYDWQERKDNTAVSTQKARPVFPPKLGFMISYMMRHSDLWLPADSELDLTSSLPDKTDAAEL